MARIYDLEKGIYISLDFDKNYIHEGKVDFESWISFVLEIILDGERYFSSKESDSMMNFMELKNFINGIRAFIKSVKEKKSTTYEFCCLEYYFRILLTYMKEDVDNSIDVEFWLYKNSFNNIKIKSSYNIGFNFTIELTTLESFINEIDKKVMPKNFLMR